jgi:hypothetical protein
VNLAHVPDLALIPVPLPQAEAQQNVGKRFNRLRNRIEQTLITLYIETGLKVAVLIIILQF